ncbi:hypothetical protein U27_01178 [Candidatus Vecturithrix granuli]|uniref:Uncharacterized protein n=1 Tax=Vecturithrix granuli TaxID=1499967 RepID=A0A081C9M3_VECG1|nr:hypothetical protein U27_01178 [Candidatus Vecturithrix granuli]
MEIHGFPIFDENGNVARMIEYALDIIGIQQFLQPYLLKGEHIS